MFIKGHKKQVNGSYSDIIGDDINKVEQYIRENLVSKQKILESVLKELVEAGGKRLRPALVLLSGKFGKYDANKLIPMAAAIEILHTATLVHDDVIDEAKIRRGIPTVHTRWGKDVAVFTGDFLFSKAFLLLTRSTSFENMQNLSKVIKAICEGEIGQYQARYNKHVTVRQYLKRIGRKTALLFSLSCYIGAHESGCSRSIIRLLGKFGFNFGMAFQITDDLLDFTGDPAKTGKPVGRDFVQGVYTLPLIYTLNSPLYKDETESLIDKQEYEQRDVERVIELVHLSGGIDYSKQLASKYLKRAYDCMQKLPSIPARMALDDLVKGLIGRNH